MRQILVANVRQNVTLQDPVGEKPHQFIEKWLKLLRDETTAWPVGCAKPINLGDYRRLGTLLKMEYLGVPQERKDGEPILDKHVAGKTVFHTVSWNDNGEAFHATTVIHQAPKLSPRRLDGGRDTGTVSSDGRGPCELNTLGCSNCS